LNGWFSLTGAVKHNGGYPPQDTLDHWLPFFNHPNRGSMTTL